MNYHIKLIYIPKKYIKSCSFHIGNIFKLHSKNTYNTNSFNQFLS